MTRYEVLAEAKALVRTLGSAPDPLRHAVALLALVRRSGPWTPEQERTILVFSEWLAARPPPSALKPRCQQLLRDLG